MARPIDSFLYLLSLGYKAAVLVRNFLYDKGIFKQTKVDLFVISIGNIVAGGSGKTPLTLYIAERLCQKKKVAILLRGYRSKAEKRKTPIFVEPYMQAEDVGDEALLYARKLPQVFVIAGKSRLLGAEMAKEAGAEVILLDDGMQHRKIARDIEIVIKPPFETHYFLPRGLIRDDPRRMQKADIVVKTKISEKKVYDFKGNPWPKTLKGEKIALFSGIGYPKGFEKSVQEMGAIIVDMIQAPDHKLLKASDLYAFSQKAKEKGATLLLCTEKDFVKYLETPKSALPIAYLQIGIEIVEGKESIERLVE